MSSEESSANPMETAAGLLSVLEASWEECEGVLVAAGFTREDWARWQALKAIAGS